MKKAKKLYLCTENMEWEDDKGKKHNAIQKYIGTINPIGKQKYFEGAWFDEDNKCAGTVEISKEDFKKQIISCKELTIE